MRTRIAANDDFPSVWKRKERSLA